MKMCEMVGWWTRICTNPGKKEEYTQTELRIQQYSIEKYLWNRLQTTEAILPPPVNPPISVQLGAVRVDPATQYFSNPTHLYLDAFLLLSFFLNLNNFRSLSITRILKNGPQAISIQNLLLLFIFGGCQIPI